jgi:putative Ca2+/H+ antiporter (TMEM165/GDT1 family)
MDEAIQQLSQQFEHWQQVTIVLLSLLINVLQIAVEHLEIQVFLTVAMTSFALIFAAEMGDKSQLVCMTLAARHRAMPVALGATAAFMVLNTLAVIFGVAIAKWLPEYVVSGGVALLFLSFGIGTLRAHSEDEEEAIVEKSNQSIFLTTFGLITVAEFGDKTQLAVVALSSTHMPFGVWAGATAALTLTSVLGCIAGQTLLKKISVNALHKISGSFFIALGCLAAYQSIGALF